MRTDVFINYAILATTALIAHFFTVPVSLHLIIDAVCCIYIGSFHSLERENVY